MVGCGNGRRTRPLSAYISQLPEASAPTPRYWTHSLGLLPLATTVALPRCMAYASNGLPRSLNRNAQGLAAVLDRTRAEHADEVLRSPIWSTLVSSEQDVRDLLDWFLRRLLESAPPKASMLPSAWSWTEAMACAVQQFTSRCIGFLADTIRELLWPDGERSDLEIVALGVLLGNLLRSACAGPFESIVADWPITAPVDRLIRLSLPVLHVVDEARQLPTSYAAILVYVSDRHDSIHLAVMGDDARACQIPSCRHLCEVHRRLARLGITRYRYRVYQVSVLQRC